MLPGAAMLEAAAAAAAALVPAEARQQLALCAVTIPAPLMLGTQVRSPEQPGQSISNSIIGRARPPLCFSRITHK